MTEKAPSLSHELRTVAGIWGMTAIFPLLILVTIDPQKTGDIACAYLGLASGWLAVEIHRFGNPPASTDDWLRKTLTATIAIGANVAIFILFGITANIQTHFPFPLMAVLSALPAIGLLPFLIRRVRHPHVAMLWTALILLASKLTGCIVARIVYGPDFLEAGYIAADWRTAKLMITIFWTLSTTISCTTLLADYQNAAKSSRQFSIGVASR